MHQTQGSSSFKSELNHEISSYNLNIDKTQAGNVTTSYQCDMGNDPWKGKVLFYSNANEPRNNSPCNDRNTKHTLQILLLY